GARNGPADAKGLGAHLPLRASEPLSACVAIAGQRLGDRPAPGEGEGRAGQREAHPGKAGGRRTRRRKVTVRGRDTTEVERDLGHVPPLTGKAGKRSRERS